MTNTITIDSTIKIYAKRISPLIVRFNLIAVTLSASIYGI